MEGYKYEGRGVRFGGHIQHTVQKKRVKLGEYLLQKYLFWVLLLKLQKLFVRLPAVSDGRRKWEW